MAPAQTAEAIRQGLALGSWMVLEFLGFKSLLQPLEWQADGYPATRSLGSPYFGPVSALLEGSVPEVGVKRTCAIVLCHQPLDVCRTSHLWMLLGLAP